jgi:uncharacterized protein
MADLPFFDLFLHLKAAGMALAPEQYDLLQRSLEQGYGIKGWEDLRRICRLLWVKPCPSLERDLFDVAFDRYVQKLRTEWQSELEPPETRSDLPVLDSPVLPLVPPRRMPDARSSPAQAPVALKTAPPALGRTQANPRFHLVPTQQPVSLEMIRGSWQIMRQGLREGTDYELDLDGTVAQINRDGFFSDVVMRPCLSQRAELIVLVDENAAMTPYQPAIQPLIKAIAERRISPAKLYRFISFPDEVLYDWQKPTQALPLLPILSRLHRSRTVVIIVSDAGAATATYSPERIAGVVRFLEQISPCVRRLLWLNPLPSERWRSTSAQAIAQVLDGRMISLDADSLQRMARTPLPLPG